MVNASVGVVPCAGGSRSLRTSKGFREHASKASGAAKASLFVVVRSHKTRTMTFVGVDSPARAGGSRSLRTDKGFRERASTAVVSVSQDIRPWVSGPTN